MFLIYEKNEFSYTLFICSRKKVVCEESAPHNISGILYAIRMSSVGVSETVRNTLSQYFDVHNAMTYFKIF